ncbi:hypothetical protein DUT91_14580 [Phyllobacterium salinisoli]|uniref:Uncharacterized protein n=1 Tax=Phyllobacterium salinisoli TaxID=1899321 RepID=A0A368K277_9HYPH|nr:hypothetical protein [Phyllobacterium salinisoli]RCS23489.1 hypothetical protein DUT91_14580 [Phyllobacterium salinisoli]
MTNAVVLGLEGKTDLWLVDFDAGTVAPVEHTSDFRKSGKPMIKGIDLAVAINSAPDVGSGFMDK